MPGFNPRALLLIVGCHFVSSFAILGMSPYFGIVLSRSFHQNDPSWGGVFYVIPLLTMALAGPLWGAFADRFGKRISLARAQVGLALALWCCSQATSMLSFAACLVVQGIFGGTFSASNALLTQYYRGEQLSKALSYLQYSACLSLFAAPSLMGSLLLNSSDPQRAYAWLWILPACSFVLMQRALPRPPELPPDSASAQERPAHGLPFHAVIGVEFCYTLMTVLSYPYFVPFFLKQQAALPPLWAGLFFGTPHVVYLLLAFVLIRRAETGAALRSVRTAFALFAVAMLVHLTTAAPLLLWLARVTIGLSLTLGYVYLAQLVGSAVRPASAGRAFGWLDTANKFAGVFAGLAASLAVRSMGLAGPFALAAGLGLVMTLAVGSLLRKGDPV